MKKLELKIKSATKLIEFAKLQIEEIEHEITPGDAVEIFEKMDELIMILNQYAV